MPDGEEPAPYPDVTPLPEEYGRVTNPERFAVLHDVVDRLVGGLCDEFDVERDDDPPLLRTPPDTVVRAVRLVPAASGAPVTLICTTFPGVNVVFGESHTWGYPICGCDACNDDPEDLRDELEADVLGVVRGHFTEYRNKKGETGFRIDYVADERRGDGYKAGTPSGRLSEHRWPAWTAR
jgi:hypothetical protein